jgi:predicted site-specific integrase-resolvase
MSNLNYVPRKKVLETLGIHYQTLYNLVKRKEIESIKIGRVSVYNLDKYIKDNNILINNKEKICYCRVSSQKQKEDLERQINLMKKLYPNYRVISDIGSGLNFKRKGLQELINLAIKNQIDEVVVAYKDRLARFGFELIENIIKTHSHGSIKILNKSEEKTPSEELTEDIIAIMNVYVAKVNGLRKYEKNLTEIIKEECRNNKIC